MASKSSWDVLTTNDGDVLENGESTKRFSIRNYVPAKSNVSCSKAIFIGGGVIVAALIIIVASVLIKNKYSQPTTYYELILSDGNTLWEVNPQTKNHFTLRHVSQKNGDINTFDIYKESLLYSHNTSIGAIYSSALSTSVQDNVPKNVVFNQTNLVPDASAIDFLTGNLYFVDIEIGGLIVFNVHTKYNSLIFSGLDKPNAIVLDPYEGTMFISQKSDSILRMNMDGSSLTKVVNDSLATYLSIDHNTKRIYWISDYISIKSSDYNGQNIETIMTDSKLITSFAVVENQLFWLWGSKNASMGYCTIKNGGCTDLKDQSLEQFHNPKVLKNIQVHKNDSISEACEINNGGCEHLCLAKPNNERSCVCSIGWQLNADSMTCRKAGSVILYSTTNHIKGRIPYNSKSESVDAIWPVEYNIEGTLLSFDYDVENDDFYFNNASHIYQMKLKTPGKLKLLYKVGENTDLTALAYDWSTKNLYFNKHIAYSYENHTLFTIVLNVGQANQTKILHTSEHNDFVSSYLYRVLLNIDKHYFLVSGKQDWAVQALEKLTMNGTKVTLNFNEFVKAIDFDKEIFYSDAGRSDVRIINRFDLNNPGTHRLELNLNDDSEVGGMSIEEQWLYLQTEKGIYRCNKDNGKALKKIVPEHPDILPLTETLTFMKVFSTTPSKLEKNPCEINNGGCKEFCFVTDDNAICECEDDKVVQKDGSCV